MEKTWPGSQNREQGGDRAFDSTLLSLVAEAAVDVVHLCEGGDDGGEIEVGKNPNGGQVEQTEQAAHNSLRDPGHLEAIEKGGGENPGATCFEEKLRVQGGELTEQGEAGSPEQVPVFLLPASLHNREQASNHRRRKVGSSKEK